MEQKKFKILIADNLAKEGVEVFKPYENFEVDIKTKHTEQELIDIIPPYHAIIVRSATKITEKILNAAKNLKVIARAGTGYDNIDLDACTKHGIVVLITPLGNSNAVVELTLGMMLDHARHISAANYSMIGGKWEKSKFNGSEIKGKTVGIIGLGRIGTGVAKRCKAFEMNVIAFDKFIPKKHAEELGIILVDELDELLGKSDYITVHIPLTEQTKDLIDGAAIKKMKPNAVILNVARGGIVNEKALSDALKEKIIGGACMDVYTKEPPAKEEFPFIGMDNCISTPHLGASTSEAQIDVAKMASDHVIQALRTNIFIDAVNIPFNLSEDLADIYGPFMQLGSVLASFISQYSQGRTSQVIIKYKGEIFQDFAPIKAVILHSLFKDKMMEYITYMNLDKILQENGIKVILEKYDKRVNFENYIKIYIKNEDGIESKIAGTVFLKQPKIVEINGTFFDVAPTTYMLVITNKDLPGVVGKVGTFLGNKKINIAGFYLGRIEGKDQAISIITVDDPLSADDIEGLKTIPEIIDAKAITI